MITVFAPAGIGEVGPDTDLAAEVVRTTATDESGPLRSGDILVVTSKVVSKVEARFLPADQRERAIDDESVRTVARRGPTRIVRTRHGLTVAAAGVDNSNVTPESILLLPVDPDASAARLRHRLQELTGLRLGVVISDTAGRAWRIGQTDQAIGSSGVRVIDRYEGRTDPYGNELRVTAVAVADELAGAADLVKTKLSGRPVAVVRGLSDQLADDGEPDEPRAADPPEADVAAAETRAAVLVRDESTDMFRFGSREAVIAAVLHATGQSARYEAVLAHPTEAELVDAVLRGSGRTGAEADLLRLVLEAAFAG